MLPTRPSPVGNRLPLTNTKNHTHIYIYTRARAQAVISTAELYGGFMTFMPDILEGAPNLASRTQEPVLFWIYLVFMNGSVRVSKNSIPNGPFSPPDLTPNIPKANHTTQTYKPTIQPDQAVGRRAPAPALGIRRPHHPRLRGGQDGAPAQAGARPRAALRPLVPARGRCVYV